MTSRRIQPTERKRNGSLRRDVVAAIERAWPDGVVEMSVDLEESWFWDLHPRLARAFDRLTGARMLHQRRAEGVPLWADQDDDFSHECDLSRSYHLFFVSPEDDAFTFEAETASQDEESSGELETIVVGGRGHIGWSVAVSLIAPFAVIALSDYTVFEDGTASDPLIERYVEDRDGTPMNPEEDFRRLHGEVLFQAIQKLRARIGNILERHGVTVLTEGEWRKPVPWLRGGGAFIGGAFIGDAINQPVRVLDAFFFEGP